ncbi:hypothetical protein AB2B38_006600 [Balneola sp. MJW-20]|uniref:hypothetical protein n=1 Tax=Gracilimonas aurantiaca TaxID=3234185 RepID=UPI003467627F
MKEHIRKWTLTAGILLLISSMGLAQDQERRRDRIEDSISLEERADIRIAVMKEYMDLDETEANAYRESFITLEKKAVAAMRKTRRHPRTRRAEAIDLRKEHLKEMQKILSKDHFTVFLENHEAIQYDIRQRLKEKVRKDDQ